jgi:hypothetical protein
MPLKDLDTNIRSLQKAVDALEVAHVAVKEFMEEQEGNRWKPDFLGYVCYVQNAIYRLKNSEPWYVIEEAADRMPRPGEGKG